jgi:fucose 4-O-acetylase-like acetyltransferase
VRTALTQISRGKRPATGRKSSTREPRWDNARFVAGTLVVLVHMSGSLADRDGLRWLYLATWAMRVPLFAVLAGYFSSAEPLRPREARRLIESVLVPYLAVGLLHTAQIWLLYDRLELFVVNPAWGLWFLLSLFFWRMSLPYLAHLRYPLATAVVVALAAGYVSDIGTDLSLSRTLTYLPFFLVGWKLRQRGRLREAFEARWSAYAALAVVGVAFVAAWFLRADVKGSTLRMKGPYAPGNPLDEPWAWLERGAVLGLGSLIALAALRLVPQRRVPFLTALGAGGMYIYILHPLVLRVYQRHWGYDWVGPWYDQIALVLMAVALGATLASPPVRRLTKPVVQPRLPWLFRPEQPAAGKSPQSGPPAPPSAAAHAGEERVPEQTGARSQSGVLTMDAAAYTR